LTAVAAQRVDFASRAFRYSGSACVGRFLSLIGFSRNTSEAEEEREPRLVCARDAGGAVDELPQRPPVDPCNRRLGAKTVAQRVDRPENP